MSRKERTPPGATEARQAAKALSEGDRAEGPPRLFIFTNDLPEREDLPFCRTTNGDGDYWGVVDYWATRSKSTSS